MKTTLMVLWLLAGLCIAIADPDKAFNEDVATVRSKHSAERSALFEKFGAAAKRLRQSFIAKGDLDNALEAGKVLEAAEKGTAIEASFPGLPPLRKILDDRLEKISKAEAGAIRKLRQAQIKRLEKEVVELTKASLLEQAVEVDEALKKHKILLASETSATPGEPPSALDTFGKKKPSARGLEIQLYAIQKSQLGGDNYNGYVSYKDLVEPVGKARAVKSLNWSKSSSQNAVVSGYLKIEKSGTYGFRTNSDFDRNELIVDGKIVCKFRDGEGKAQTIELAEGLVPIVSVGYVRQTRQTRVHWKPPGQEEWSAIPTTLLFHE